MSQEIFFYYFSLLQPVSQYKESKNHLYKLIPCLLHWCFISYLCPWEAVVSQSLTRMPYCCSGSRRLRNCQSSSITLADDFTTSLSPTSYSPKAYCPCQTGLKAPITTGCPPLPHSLSRHKLPAYLVPNASHNLSWRRVHPNSVALPYLSSYNCTTSACAAFSTQYLLLKSGALPTPTSHPTVLAATSHRLPAQSFAIPQAFPIS